MNEHEDLTLEEWQQISERMDQLERIDRVVRTAIDFDPDRGPFDWTAARPTENWAERVRLARRVIACVSHGTRIPWLVDVGLVVRSAAVLRVHDRYGFPPDDVMPMPGQRH